MVVLGAAVVILVSIKLQRHRGSMKPVEQVYSETQKPVPEPPSVDRRKYNEVRSKVEKERLQLWSRYQRATSEKETIINEARESFVRSASEDLMPYWYKTQWDFYGTTESPGQGKIACGYFVSTILSHLGMKVQRTRLAQQASENIILSLTTNEHTKRFRQVPIKSFIESVKNWGPGLYVVGLDVHVGFILNIAGDVYFIHSSYVDPYCVVKENGLDSKILLTSAYRVLGKLSEDNDLILKWLKGDPFRTRVS